MSFTLIWRLPAEPVESSVTAAIIGPRGLSATWREGVLGDGAATAFTITHGLGTFSVGVEIVENAPPYATRIADVTRPTPDTVTIAFAAAPAPNQYRYILHGPPGAGTEGE